MPVVFETWLISQGAWDFSDEEEFSDDEEKVWDRSVVVAFGIAFPFRTTKAPNDSKWTLLCQLVVI